MKRKQAAPSPRDRIKDLLRRVREHKPSHGEFCYTERGQGVTEAHALFNEASDLRRRFPANAELLEAVTTMRQRWLEAMEAAYPHGFWDDIEKLRGGDAAGLESAIRFLEADPYFFGTGYNKVHLVRYIKPSMLTRDDFARLQAVVLAKVENLIGQDFSTFCRLSKKVDDANLREQLRQRADQGNFDVRRRARWVLEALAQKDSMEKANKPMEK